MRTFFHKVVDVMTLGLLREPKWGWTDIGLGGRATTSSEKVSEDSALNYSAVWCATRLLCGTASSLPLPVYQWLPDERRTKNRTHPAFRLLNRAPNPEMTAASFRSIMWQWQVNWGNAYAEIVREGNAEGAPLQSLWPIHPSRVRMVRNDDDVLIYEVHEHGEWIPVPRWRMFHVPSIITLDGIVGKGVIQHARETIGMGIATEKYGAHWFGGGGVPRVTIELPAGTTWDEQKRDAFRKEWDQIYSSPDGRRIALLQGGAKANPLNVSAEDSQFLETRQHNVEEIARWYGIPPHLLQHLMRATYSNIEHQGIDFVRYCLIPWLEIWEQAISSQLLAPREQEEYFVEHNVDALLRGDSASRAKFYKDMTSAALMTRNECRIKENLDPVDGGDTFLVQGATVPLDDDGVPLSQFANPDLSGQPDRTSSGDLSSTLTMTDHPGYRCTVKLMQKELQRVLTKETKAIQGKSKQSDDFVDKIEEFYTSHAIFLKEAVAETFEALNECGVPTDPDLFVATWCGEGKKIILEASGRACPANLNEIIYGAVSSNEWAKRPRMAVEKVTNATNLV